MRAPLLAFPPLIVALAAPSPARAVGVDVALGLGVINWDFNASPIEDTTTFDDDVDPFIVRNLEVNFHGLWGFEGGLGYLTNQLLGFAGLSASDQFSGVDDPIASMLSGYVAYDFGLIALQGQAQLRRFELQRTYTGQWIDATLPLTYLPREGAQETLAPGAKSNWTSESTDVQARLLVSAMALFAGDTDDYSEVFGRGSRFDWYFGYHRLSYSAPIIIELTPPQDLLNTASSLMGTQLTGHLFDTGVYFDKPAIADDSPIGFRLRLPVEMGVMSAENSYFEGSGGVMIGFGLDVALSYAARLGPVSLWLQGGFQVNWFSATLIDDEVTVMKDVPYINVIGQPGVLAGNQVVEFSLEREEVYWGPYLNLVVGFSLFEGESGAASEAPAEES